MHTGGNDRVFGGNDPLLSGVVLLYAVADTASLCGMPMEMPLEDSCTADDHTGVLLNADGWDSAAAAAGKVLL